MDVWGCFVIFNVFCLFAGVPFFYSMRAREKYNTAHLDLVMYLFAGVFACMLGPILLFAAFSLGVGCVAKRTIQKTTKS